MKMMTSNRTLSGIGAFVFGATSCAAALLVQVWVWMLAIHVRGSDAPALEALIGSSAMTLAFNIPFVSLFIAGARRGEGFRLIDWARSVPVAGTVVTLIVLGLELPLVIRLRQSPYAVDWINGSLALIVLSPVAIVGVGALVHGI